MRDAKVFLMDEPLSKLDAKLRVQMRAEIAKLHQRLGTTTIYVTHDQTEAMTMATRLVVMKDGVIQQVGTPKEVYEKPEMSIEERLATWRKLEKQYLPQKNYEGIEILEKGGWWMRQLHIFMDPFYYIDYTLAQVCALQFWARIQKNDEKAFEDYKHICKIGGTLPFRKIVKEAGLKVPFESGCLKDTVQLVREWFEKADDSQF